jgi:radial spoke head protein 1
MLNGNGEFIWPNGDRYIGRYLNGKRYGFGKMIFGNGNSYTGTWKLGMYHGQGTFK